MSLALPCLAEPLAQTAAVQTRPDPAAPIVTYLKAGSEPVPATTVEEPPPGWMAVQLPGPFDAYVLNRDLTKGLDVKTGAPIYLEPKPDSGVLTTAAKGDKTEITGLYGRWTKIQLHKDLVGYVQLASATSAPLIPLQSAPPGEAPAQVAPGPGKPVSVEDAALPRFFEGQFVSSQHPLMPRRPFDWQLDDSSGTRFAYLDLGKLLLTDQIDRYIDHSVVVYGTLKPMPGGKDLVIDVESLRLQ